MNDLVKPLSEAYLVKVLELKKAGIFSDTRFPKQNLRLAKA